MFFGKVGRMGVEMLIKQYLKNTCKSTNSKDFWRNVKPLISNKVKCQTDQIILMENDAIVNNDIDICNVLNDYYVTAADNIGCADPILDDDTLESITNRHHGNESITHIKSKSISPNQFSFDIVHTETILKKLKSINVKKATGHDSIPPKLLKLGADVLAIPLTNLINMSISTCTFPEDLKLAETNELITQHELKTLNNK